MKMAQQLVWGKREKRIQEREAGRGWNAVVLIGDDKAAGGTSYSNRNGLAGRGRPRESTFYYVINLSLVDSCDRGLSNSYSRSDALRCRYLSCSHHQLA